MSDNNIEAIRASIEAALRRRHAPHSINVRWDCEGPVRSSRLTAVEVLVVPSGNSRATKHVGFSSTEADAHRALAVACGLRVEGDVVSDPAEEVDRPVVKVQLHWADDFDADLHRVVPEARAALGIDADARLWVLQRHRGDSMLVHPACWSGHEAEYVTPVFFTREQAMAYTGPHDRLDALGVTFDDLWRDAWVHGYAVRFGDTHSGVWLMRADRLQGYSLALMHDLREPTHPWLSLSPREKYRARDATRRAILRSRVALHQEMLRIAVDGAM